MGTPAISLIFVGQYSTSVYATDFGSKESKSISLHFSQGTMRICLISSRCPGLPVVLFTKDRSTMSIGSGVLQKYLNSCTFSGVTTPNSQISRYSTSASYPPPPSSGSAPHHNPHRNPIPSNSNYRSPRFPSPTPSPPLAYLLPSSASSSQPPSHSPTHS